MNKAARTRRFRRSSKAWAGEYVERNWVRKIGAAAPALTNPSFLCHVKVGGREKVILSRAVSLWHYSASFVYSFAKGLVTPSSPAMARTVSSTFWLALYAPRGSKLSFKA